LRSRPYTLFLSAALKGGGGGLAVVKGCQSAFIADVSSPESRSAYLGLAQVVVWVASAIAPLISAVFLEKKLFAMNFGVAAGAWILCLLYVAFALKEPRKYPSEDEGPSESDSLASVTEGAETNILPWHTRFHVFVNPLALVFRNFTLRLLGIITFLMLITGSFGVLVVYADRAFRLSPGQVSVTYIRMVFD
jgi:hypothetical protein